MVSYRWKIHDRSLLSGHGALSTAASHAQREVTVMQPAPPAAMQLAQRLRQLRLQHWPDSRLTQGKLAKAFSVEENLAAATVASWESRNSPKLPPRHRLRAYARFFASQRSTGGADPKFLPLDELTPDEKNEYEKLEAELFSLRRAASGESAEEAVTSGRSWHFADGGRVTVVCAQLPKAQMGALGNPENPNYSEIHAYADADALIELHGHIRAENPPVTVNYRIPDKVEPDEFTGHLVLLGGVVWNDITERLSEMVKLPVRQVVNSELSSGEIFVAEANGEERQFWPEWTEGKVRLLAEDVGLLARLPNPLNSSRTLTICNGIHSRGVYGAVRTLTDLELRDANQRYIATHFGNAESFAILMSVQVIRNKPLTPDFNSPGVVLYEWSEGAVA